MLYAERNIKEIIEEIKANDKIKWKDTIIIITSDNGGDTGFDTRGYDFGSNLPLRGRKS